MEATGEFLPDRAARPGSVVAFALSELAAVRSAAGSTGSAAEAVHSSVAVDGSVVEALALLRASSGFAAADAAGLDFFEASDFADQVEDLSRTVEYFQVIAAAAVDRTRREAAAAQKAPAGWGSDAAATSAAGWLTGWTQEPGAEPGDEAGSRPDARSEAGTGLPAGPAAAAAAAVCAAADDGYRNSAEFLRARLRIGASEAKRRLRLAAELLPRTGIAGRALPPARSELAAAVAAGNVATRTAIIIAMSLDQVRPVAPAEAVDRMEQALTRTAVENDPDFLARVARRWVEALNQDGTEPSEEALRRLQGAFIRKPRHGLHHLEIFATTDQFEHLATVMNVATNPRTGTPAAPDEGNAGETDAGGAAASGTFGAATDSDGDDAPGSTTGGSAAARLDPRTRPQKLLDGLVGACKAALASGGLPAAGGLRPQIMATINYQDLLDQLDGLGGTGGPGTWADGPAGRLRTNGTAGGSGSLLFTGPVAAATVRKLACDADIIPVLLGGEGRILDIGRASRVFPPHIRKAITARDQGCAFPQCTIPATWCEAHHITYWSRGGTTGTDNGTLLCSHHHHLIHKEQWTIQMRGGIPWFIPPPHLDPGQTPRRNHYFRLE